MLPAVSGSFRPIHYLGSKLRLVDRIRSLVDQVDPAGGALCDLFAGSGTVSAAFASSRDLIAVDIQEYSRVLCSALLHPADLSPAFVANLLDTAAEGDHALRLAWIMEPLVAFERNALALAADGDQEPLCDLLEHGSLVMFQQGQSEACTPKLLTSLQKAAERLRAAGLENSPGSLITRHFGGIYFSFQQAVQLDGLLEAANSTSLDDRDSCVAVVLSTASDIVNTVGKQFAQPIRPRNRDGTPKRHLADKIQRDRSADAIDVARSWVDAYRALPRTGRPHEAVRRDYLAFLRNVQSDIGVIYADPPYTRDHYSRFYHVLETMCLRDNPAVSTSPSNGGRGVSRGLYRESRHQSPFCIKTQAPGAFTQLFAEARRLDVPLVLSYSPYAKDRGARPRLMTIEGIVDLARRAFRHVEVVSGGDFVHSKLNSSDRNVEVTGEAEVFVVCDP